VGRWNQPQVGLLQARSPLPLGLREHRQEARRLLTREAILVGGLPVPPDSRAERGEVLAHERGRERVVVHVGQRVRPS